VNKDIVKRIEQVIEYLELSVSAFADEIGVQRSSISHLLNGRNKPSLDFIMKLVNTYPEVDLYWLLKGEGNFPKEEAVPEKSKIEPKKDIFPEKLISDNPQLEFPAPSQKNISTGQPDKIVFFYPDGTFKTYHAKKD
jgi:transcriptional regulator with XRE-family HTH domain